MDWIINYIKDNPVASLLLPSGLNGVGFFANLLIAMSDGQIDSAEMHKLMSSASGVQLIILIIVMVALSKNGADKK